MPLLKWSTSNLKVQPLYGDVRGETEMEDYLFYFGWVAVTPFTISFALGLIVMLALSMVEVYRYYLPLNTFFGFFALTVIAGVVGSRCWYVYWYEPQYYGEDPLRIVVLQDGGVHLVGGLLAVFLLTYLWSWWKREHLGKYLDVLMPGLSLALALLHTGIEDRAKAITTSLSWFPFDFVQDAHPVQSYYIVLILILFAWIWNSRRDQMYYGELTAKFLMGMGLIEFITGFFRYELIYVGIWDYRQVLGIVIFMVGIIYWRSGKILIPHKKGYSPPEEKNLLSSMAKLIMLLVLMGGMVYLHHYLMYGGFG